MVSEVSEVNVRHHLEMATSGSELPSAFILSACHVMKGVGCIMLNSRYIGTGSRISKRLILTARHVHALIKGKNNAFIRFHDYGKPILDCLKGKEEYISDFPLNVTSIYENTELDYAIIAIKEPPKFKREEHERQLSGVTILTSVLLTGKETLIGDRINIFSYFNGSSQQLSMRKNKAIRLIMGDNTVKEVSDNPNKLFYKADTSGGSSGAPLFNDLWQLVGIHKGGISIKNRAIGKVRGTSGYCTYMDKVSGKGDEEFFVNYGVLIKPILEDMYLPRSGQDSLFEMHLKEAAEEDLGIPFESALMELKDGKP